MPFSFALPTTSALNLTSFLRSDTHPSLIAAATTYRSLLRNALKQHRRLPPKEQGPNLQRLTAAFDEYMPYLLALDSGLSNKRVNDEEIDVILENEVEVEWRPTIAASSSKRIKGRGLDLELSFVLSARAYLEFALARNAMQMFHRLPASSVELRKEPIKQATDHLLCAASIHQYLAARNADMQFPQAAVDIVASSQTALFSLAMAEATLLSILLHDPYLAIIAQDRDKSDREWMYKAPDIPKVRAGLFARLGIRSSEHAERAFALLSSGPDKGKAFDESLMKYISNLQVVSKAKGCRFFGIESELGGKIGEGIGWLIAGKKILGYQLHEADGGKVKAISKMKMDWAQKREDKKVEKGGDWGSDAGRIEEGRVFNMLLGKWHKANDLISTQPIPISDYLVARMPYGRDFHTPKPYIPPQLDAEILNKKRAPPDEEELETLRFGIEGSSDDETTTVPGAFPEQRPEGTSTYY